MHLPWMKKIPTADTFTFSSFKNLIVWRSLRDEWRRLPVFTCLQTRDSNLQQTEATLSALFRLLPSRLGHVFVPFLHVGISRFCPKWSILCVLQLFINLWHNQLHDVVCSVTKIYLADVTVAFHWSSKGHNLHYANVSSRFTPSKPKVSDLCSNDSTVYERLGLPSNFRCHSAKWPPRASVHGL